MKKTRWSCRMMILFCLFLVSVVAGIVIVCIFLPRRAERAFPPGIVRKEMKRRVVVYSSLQELQLEALKQAFEARYPDILLDYYCAGTGKILTKVSTERQQGDILADLLWVGDPDSYASYLDADLLVSYSSAYEDDIPEQFQFTDARLTAARLIVMGFAYNIREMKGKKLPATWDDLLATDGVVFADPASSGTMLYTLRALICDPRYGWGYWEALKASGAEVCGGSGATGYQVGTGVYQVGIVPDHIAAMVRNMGLPVAFTYPDDCIVIPSPIALFKESPNPEEGMLLFDFILSDEGQAVLASVDIVPVRGAHASLTNTSNDMNRDGESPDRQELLERFDSLFLK